MQPGSEAVAYMWGRHHLGLGDCERRKSLATLYQGSQSFSHELTGDF